MPSGRVYTFHLRQNASFHDGRPIKAADVRASLLRALAPGSTGGRSWPLYPIRGARAYAAGSAKEVAGIAVRDDSTLALTLEEPLNIFPKLLAMPVAAIVPTPTPPTSISGPTGSGPWKFVSWSHDDAIVLAKNQSYWGGAPKSDTLRIRIIPEPLTQAAEYEAGQLSVVEVPVGETRRWEQTHADELQRRPALRDLYVAINTTRGPLKDLRVRRALNHAVDVRTLLGTVMADRGVLAAGSLPPGIAGLRLDPGAVRLRSRQGQAAARRGRLPQRLRDQALADPASRAGPAGPVHPAGPGRGRRPGRDRGARCLERSRGSAQR